MAFFKADRYNVVMNIIWGLIWIAVGMAMLIYNRQLYNFTGAIDFIESHWTAGTPSFLKLFAVALVIIGLSLATGVGGWLISPITDMAGKVFPSQSQ